MSDAAASLANLHDIVLPGPVPWWPPAPAWYVAGLLLLLLLGWLALAGYRRHRSRRYRVDALAELAAIESAAGGPAKRQDALRALPALLKRTALACWPRDRVASLSAADWWRFLDDSSGGEAFSGSYGALLEELSYRENARVTDTEIQGLLTASRHWIRHHDCPEQGR